MERQEVRTVTLGVGGMGCAGCAASIERLLREAEGVRTAQVSFERAEAVVEIDPARIDREAVGALLVEAGYTVPGS